MTIGLHDGKGMRGREGEPDVGKAGKAQSGRDEGNQRRWRRVMCSLAPTGILQGRWKRKKQAALPQRSETRTEWGFFACGGRVLGLRAGTGVRVREKGLCPRGWR